MAHQVCPWWLGYCLLCPWLRGGQKPGQLLATHVHEGMIVLEPGPGMGYFTLELARLVGPLGRVIALDIQPKMIERLKTRAAKAGLQGRLDARAVSPNSMGLGDLKGKIDFTLAFAVVHEFPSVARFFGEVAAASKPGATLLLAEPKGHVKSSDFDAELQAASQAGFATLDRPAINRSQSALLKTGVEIVARSTAHGGLKPPDHSPKRTNPAASHRRLEPNDKSVPGRSHTTPVF